MEKRKGVSEGFLWKALIVLTGVALCAFGMYKFYKLQTKQSDVYNEGYKDNLSFVSIVKNEGPYIKEWIEYHKLVGVDRFYIYDNESSDNLQEVLKDYIRSGEVVYKYYPGAAQQVPAYTEALNNYKNNTKYMGFIDLDEFVVPVEGGSILETVEDIMSKNDKIAGVGINWRIYGSSGLEEKPEGLVTENYKYRALDDFDSNSLVKTICDPRKVINIGDAHYENYKDGFYCVNDSGDPIRMSVNPGGECKRLRINHYFSKSKSEYIKKKDRGMADHVNEKRDMGGFYYHDRNDVYDYIMEKYVDVLKERV